MIGFVEFIEFVGFDEFIGLIGFVGFAAMGSGSSIASGVMITGVLGVTSEEQSAFSGQQGQSEWLMVDGWGVLDIHIPVMYSITILCMHTEMGVKYGKDDCCYR